MSGTIIDTDILINAARQVPEAIACLNKIGENSTRAIRVITQMELYIGCRNKMELRNTELQTRGKYMKIEPFSQKIGDFKENDLVCYCFQFTRKQIEKDCFDNGRSTILEKIAHEKKAGGCDCAQKNPKGR